MEFAMSNRYLELVDAAVAENAKAKMLDGHFVHQAIFETEAMILFLDENGRYWRYLRNYGEAWLVVFKT
jgi:hypothetical protein